MAQTADESATWFKDWYNSKGKLYLNINTCTKEDRQAVVKFNKFESEWDSLGADDLKPNEQYFCIMKLSIQKNEG